jgi:DNA-binding FadR family transcriptional regulator
MVPGEVEPVRRRKLYQEVMERLVAMIREGRLAAGDQLPSERELMERYGVGRPAVREALQNLARMGLVSISHGERARIVAPSFSNLFETIALTTSGILRASASGLEDLKQARLLFEVQMVRMAAARAGPEETARLRARHADHEASLAELGRFLHCDMLFHREIAAVTGNAIFPGLSEAVMGWLAEFHVELVRVPGAERITLEEHGRILTAIEAADPDAAEAAMTEHLTRANDLYRRPVAAG